MMYLTEAQIAELETDLLNFSHEDCDEINQENRAWAEYQMTTKHIIYEDDIPF